MSFHDKTVEAFEIQYLMSCNRHLTWEDCTVGGVLERARKEGRLKKRGMASTFPYPRWKPGSGSPGG